MQHAKISGVRTENKNSEPAEYWPEWKQRLFCVTFLTLGIMAVFGDKIANITN